ncbi:DUF3472 domain-containing protein [Pseudomonas sp. 5P_3.1_Bac2]|uniref:DUF3472 domain-containing protein n=1 Tax=Pseudomonas sp. 5P_3.1_Bac2 TaxID=2971617 RepID=UPI0021C94B82|nr:ricin-type beta-trefoil lectin domain protein [Pseudomonas sp. 5P_3.1_Bac2]MCU1717370.1 ricin-type beta-trefoil lectin domain protein [Pseudomonas sp. 5P_3.1_Bac2]
MTTFNKYNKALKTIIAFSLISLSQISSAEPFGETPGTYTNYRFASNNGQNINPIQGFTAVNFAITVDKDPGYSSNVYWSNQFNLVGTSSGAYAGMQSNGGKARTFLFSAWDTTESKPGSPESYCLTFSGEGEGRSCRLHLDWQEGHTYQFILAYSQDNWLTATVTDLTTKQAFVLGSIKTAAKRISASGMVNWAEYFEWNNPATTCRSQPYSKASMALPVGFQGNQQLSAQISSVSTSSTCSDISKVSQVTTGSIQENGIGQSVRGPLTNAGLCLDVKSGLGAGNPAISYRCTNGENQGWVRSTKDNNLVTARNLCLDGASGVKVIQCGDGQNTFTQWSLADGLLKNLGNNKCVTAVGDGYEVTLESCVGSANQKWSAAPL